MPDSNLPGPFQHNTSTDPAIKIAGVIAVLLSTIGIFIGAQIIGAVLASIIGGMFVKDASTIGQVFEDNVFARLGLTFAIEVVTIYMVFTALRLQKIKTSMLGVNKKPNMADAIWAARGYFIYFVIFFIAISIASLTGLVDTEQPQQLGFKNPQGLGLVATFISLVVLPPIAEEIMFRGYLYGRLKSFVPQAVSALITSILFSVAHLEFGSGAPLNWAAALDTFILSFVLIHISSKTKTLWPAIFLHAIKNFIAFMSLFVIK